MTVAGAVTVHLRPVEADQLIVPHGKEEAGRVEPRLAHSPVQIFESPYALLGMPGECTCVQCYPGLVITAGLEGPYGDAGRQHSLLKGWVERAAHMPQASSANEAQPAGQRARGRMLPGEVSATMRCSIAWPTPRFLNNGSTTSSALAPSTLSVTSRWPYPTTRSSMRARIVLTGSSPP